MQKEELIRRIREKCVVANPSILDLIDGCWIKIWWMDNPDEREEDEKVMFTSRSMRDNGVLDGKYHQIIEDSMCGTVEILGRDIQLSDVLLAIGKSAPKIRKGLSVNMYGGIYTTGEDNEWEEQYACNWDLTKPLHEQSVETLQFIADLLK